MHYALRITHRMTAVVLAGGQSRRMQTDKAFLEVGGKRLIERVLDVLAPLFSEILINSNTPELYQEWGFPVIADVVKKKGALGGIYTGLIHAATEGVFCVACDMPFLQAHFIKYMLARSDGCDALIPKAPDGFHPLHAIYLKSCIPAIESLLQQNRLKISNLFPMVKTHYVEEEAIRRYDPHFKSFCNINTWKDLEMARGKFQENSGGRYREM
jgi:molybdopterin-guanine dinucleotide biosynthesis protein A